MALSRDAPAGDGVGQSGLRWDGVTAEMVV